MSGSVLFDAPGPKARRLSLILSIVVGILILAGLYWLYTILAAPRPSSGGITLPGMFDPSRWDVFANPDVWTFIWGGVVRTLQAAAAAAVLALILGVVFALLRTAKSAWIRTPTTVILEFVRGMPVLLMMLFILLGFSSGAYWAVVLALGLYNGAIIGEALRAGLASLPRGQREAGLSLGLRELQTRMLIEFPQAFRQMLPIIVAQLVVLLKDTSLGYIVGYPELIRSTMNNLASFYGNRYLFSFFAVTLVIYLIMNLTLSWVARWLSKHTDSARRGGKAGKEVPVDPALAIAQASAAARQSEAGGNPGAR
ncbi:amino acid ABC transporter permease [Mycetocola zhadangensis]|uniref:Amino acid ABC transporter permease n=1 Tax=Mycetocola zhadangensis TaxID=1164595 RepID=A0A3L7ITM5_9MICO|nr:amino acid ABC transporter permease [Mycetocola zhadangensis]RLQ81545.1 amino acid ABC transporter permease [Mycetocola zhadangensis]GGF03244.1 glutamate ABC transporter permease [Mycetocola zhadangensis]